MSWGAVPAVLAVLIGLFNTATILYVLRVISLLQGSSTPLPRTFREYLEHRKGSAK